MSPRRRTAPKNPKRGYICPACDVLLVDGVAYRRCPACDAKVDWVDVRKPVWACAGCDGLVNAHVDARPYCDPCSDHYRRIHVYGVMRDEDATPFIERTRQVVFGLWGLIALYIASLVPLLLLALDPVMKWWALGLLGPLLLLPLAFGLAFLGTVGASWRELLGFARNQQTRTLHGLEHGTINVIQSEERTNAIVMGQTWDWGFSVYFDTTRHSQGRKKTNELLTRSLGAATRRIRAGETELAYDPRCGTSLLVALILAAVVGIAMGATGLFLHLSPLSVALTLVAFLLTLVLGTRPLGLLMQRHVTVATDARTSKVVKILRQGAGEGLIRYDVHIEVELE